MLTRPKPTPEERRAMAITQSHLRAHGNWKPGTTLRAHAIVPKKWAPTGKADIDALIYATWVVAVDFPGNEVGGHCTYYLDKNFNVLIISGGR